MGRRAERAGAGQARGAEVMSRNTLALIALACVIGAALAACFVIGLMGARA